MKKLLLSRYDIVEINEFNTSKLYNKPLKEMENVNVKRKKHKKSLHEILTPKEETKCRDLWIISLTKNNILSRSTLAWWGAYLNEHPEKYILIHHNYQGFTINPYATYL